MSVRPSLPSRSRERTLATSSMPPFKRPRSLLPLLLLLSLLSFAAILLFSSHSHSHSSLPSSPSLSDPRKLNLLLKVLAYNRLAPLKRCLHSLSRAHYASSDPVHLHIHLDHFHHPHSQNASLLLQEKLQSDHRILDFLDRFHWPHGDKQIIYNSENRGLQAQWIEAWWPQSDHEFAFVVEDDLELSPLFYTFLKKAIITYYYDNHNPSLFGISLQRPRFVAGKHGNKIELDTDTRFMLYQMVGTWGQLLFPKPWKEFRLWYNDHKAKDIKPILQGMVTTGWYKKMGDRIWTPWFIKFIHSRGYFNIYTNFGKERALSVSHRDAGVNYGRTAGPDSVLIMQNPTDFDLYDMKPLGSLRWYNFCFREVFPDRIVNGLNQLENVLKTFQNSKTVTLVSLYETQELVTRNLICHFEKVGLQNYFFLGNDMEVLSDLARRGYPVIYGDRFQGSEISGTDFTKQTAVKGNLVKLFLDLGYNIWLMNGNMAPVTNALPELSDQSFEFITRNDVELMFLKNSPNTRNVWDDAFISKLTEKSKTLEKENFVYLVSKALEESNHLKTGALDEWITFVELDKYNKGSTVNGKDTVVYWSGLAPVERELEKVSLRLLDEDSWCNAVVCHPQSKL